MKLLPKKMMAFAKKEWFLMVAITAIAIIIVIFECAFKTAFV
jgi:hypothetical protein